MPVSSAKILELGQAHTSVHKKNTSKQLDQTFTTILNSLARVRAIIDQPGQYSSTQLEESLSTIASMFRTAKFSTVVLPILERLSSDEDHVWFWKDAKMEDTQTPLTPKQFENMPVSTAEIDPKNPAVRKRELALLSVYGITMRRIWEAFQRTKK